MWSVGKAFKFPFQSDNGNLNKVLQIGIIFGLISALGVILNGGQDEGIGSVLNSVGGILLGVFLSGYGISALQSIFRGSDSLPQFDVGESFTRGFAVFLASLMYSIPLIIIMACAFAFVLSSSGSAIGVVFEEISNQLADPTYVPNLSDAEASALSSLPLLLCGSLIFLVPISMLIGYALQIGMIRYAVEDRSGALYEVGTNVGLVLNNLGTAFSLFIRQIGVGIIYLALGFGLIFISSILIFATSFLGDISLILVGSILSVVYGVFNTAQQISNIHLISQFAYQLGIVESLEKPKNDDMQDAYSF